MLGATRPKGCCGINGGSLMGVGKLENGSLKIKAVLLLSVTGS
jgi:hypothetical protein